MTNIVHELIEAYEAYISLLDKEIDELAGLASIHNWQSKRIETGKYLREKIRLVKKRATTNEPNY